MWKPDPNLDFGRLIFEDGDLLLVPDDDRTWLVAMQGAGPMKEFQVIDLLLAGRLAREMVAWTVGMTDYIPLERIYPFMKVLSLKVDA